MTDETREFLIQAAKEASSRAYAYYSKFKVGAAILTDDGKIYRGANIENCSYSLTICAERVALSQAVFEKQFDFEAICVYHPGEILPVPCGSCLQALSEFCENMEIIVVSDLEERSFLLSDLLPNSFKM